MHGIGGRSADANAELKVLDVCRMIIDHDIAVLTETRTGDASRLLQHLPGFSLHNLGVARENEGKNGFGIAVLVAPGSSDYVRFRKVSEHMQCIWLQCDKKMFGLGEDVMIGATYINPLSDSFTSRAVHSHYTDLFEDVLDAFQVSSQVILCGDFNAHVGELSEVSDAHSRSVLDCPELRETRRCECKSVNKAGQLLVDLAAATSLVISSGRVVGDDGKPSFTGHHGDKRSRPDHVLLSPALFKLVQCFEMKGTRASDHAGLSTVFRVNDKGGEGVNAPHHVCKAGECINKLVLRWQQDKAQVYAEHIRDNAELLAQFDEAERSGDVDKLAFCVRSLIVQAASNRAVGMSAQAKCAFKRERNRKGPLNPVWFNEECWEKRRAFIEAVKRGEARHACRFLKRESMSCNRRMKRRHTRQLRNLFLDRLFRKDPAVHALLKKHTKSHTTPVPAPAWHDHLHRHFRAERTFEESRPSARDMAVPLGRRNLPPEVLLRRGVQSGWAPEPDEFEIPDVSVLEGMLGSEFQKLSAGASSGFDAIPIPFLKHACLPVQCGNKTKQVNVLVPLMARLFKVLLTESKVPACWKVAKLSPIHKKGEVLKPGNYRMIAVSGVMYRIYANVLKNLVTDWCVKKGKIPDTQFGFFPGRSTLHPLFILRHLKHAAKKLKPRNSPRLHVAFIDFSQAYDTVPRQQLWSHLQRNAMPTPLINVIRDMYDNDEYILIDGEKRARVQPTNGVKQGCPLSPLLFSLYINDMGREISEGIEGAVTGDRVNGVSHMMYADDLGLTTNDPGEMQKMLDRLRVYAQRKGLTVNTAKSEVVHFNCTPVSPLQNPFTYDGVVLPEKDRFKYLGMLLDKKMDLKVAEEHAVRPYMAAQKRISEFAKGHDLKNRPHAMLWLSKVYGIPAGMYACQVWGTHYLREGREFDSQLQKRHLCSLRRILGVKNSATNWPVLRECGQEPLQFFWFRASIKFFNSMLDSNSEVLRRVLRADLRLASFDSSCWSAEVSNACGGMQNGDSFKQNMLRAEKIPMQEFIGDLRYRQQKVWRGADVVFCPRAANKKAVTYHKWCGNSERGPRGAPFRIPSYLFKDLDKHVLRNISRFRLRAHHLRVESCKWLGGSSICDKCECGEVQDEKHVLFFCKCTEVRELRTRYKDLFEEMFKTLRVFAPPSNADFIPFLACHHTITDSEVNAFLNQDSYRLLRFVSDLVSIFDTG